MHLNHPKTIPCPQSVEKISSMKPVHAVKKVGDRCLNLSLLQPLGILSDWLLCSFDKPPFFWVFFFFT